MEMEISVFWDIDQRSSVKVNRRFGGTHHLLLLPFYASFLLCLPFDPEDGSEISSGNVGCI
jgi:hypothetical protein